MPSSKHTWKWLAPRLNGRAQRGDRAPVARPCPATMETLGDRIMLSVSTTSFSEGGPDDENAQIMLEMLKGTLKVTADQLHVMKLIGESSPVPIPFPNADSKSPASLTISKVLNKASVYMLELDEAIFDFGETLIKGQVSANKVNDSKNKIDFIQIKMTDILVSSLSLPDQNKVSDALGAMKVNVNALVGDMYSKFESGTPTLDEALWLTLSDDLNKADELLFKGGVEFAKIGSPGLSLDDFKHKIDFVLGKATESVLKLSDPFTQKFMLDALSDYAIAADNLLDNLGGGGEDDGGGGIILLTESTGDVIT